MAKPHDNLHEEVAIDPNGHSAPDLPGFLKPDVTMLILTWVTFFIVLGILSKFAFKPILKALQTREDRIRQSLDDAQKAKETLENIEKAKENALREARTEAAKIVEETKQKAQESAKLIQKKAQEEASEILEKSKAEIEAQRSSLKKELKEETVTLAIAVAAKLLNENLDDQKNRDIVKGLIGDIA